MHQDLRIRRNNSDTSYIRYVALSGITVSGLSDIHQVSGLLSASLPVVVSAQPDSRVCLTVLSVVHPIGKNRIRALTKIKEDFFFGGGERVLFLLLSSSSISFIFKLVWDFFYFVSSPKFRAIPPVPLYCFLFVPCISFLFFFHVLFIFLPFSFPLSFPFSFPFSFSFSFFFIFIIFFFSFPLLLLLLPFTLKRRPSA